mgnify:FL=1|jgi:lipid A 3-O-deacylase
MKLITITIISILFTINNYALSGPLKKFESGIDKIMKPVDYGIDKLSRTKKNTKSQEKMVCKKNNLFESGVDKIMTPIDLGLEKIFGKKEKDSCTESKVAKKNSSQSNFFSQQNDNPQNISFYTGTFDLIDKEGDDKTTLVGIEHKNKDLFRNTWIGRFSPTTGAFVTGKSSIYLYSGIEADYNLGPVNISPSFAPGYYEAGDGKNLGSALEFKSEVKIGVDLFKNSNLGYSYSHISNNDWGDVNPGADNQSVTFSKKF